MDQKNPAGALKSLSQARAIAPNSEEVLSRYAEASLAAARRSRDSRPRDSRPLAPTVADYRYLLGTALLGIGDAAAAVPTLNEADPREPSRSRS